MIAPYYAHGGITLYCGDSLAVLSTIADRSIGLIITDPPYGTKTKPRAEWMVGEFSNILPLVVPELYRVGAANAAFYSFTSWTWMADWVMRCSPYFRQQGFLIWDKQRHSGLWSAYSWQFHWEGIYYGIKGPRPIKKYQPDILRTTEKTTMPMQKPVSIIRQLIEASAEPRDVILDPFCGTGSTLLAARALGYAAIGIDIDERSCEITAQRLSQELLLPLTLDGAA